MEECLVYELWNVSQGNSWFHLCFASLNTLLYSAACWSSHEVPCRFIQTYYVYRKTLTSLWYNLSQGKLHSLVTLMQQLWSSDTGSTSSAFLDSENWIVLPEDSQMVSLFSFSPTVSLSLSLSMSHNYHLNIWWLTHDTPTYSCTFTTSW